MCKYVDVTNDVTHVLKYCGWQCCLSRQESLAVYLGAWRKERKAVQAQRGTCKHLNSHCHKIAEKRPSHLNQLSKDGQAVQAQRGTCKCLNIQSNGSASNGCWFNHWMIGQGSIKRSQMLPASSDRLASWSWMEPEQHRNAFWPYSTMIEHTHLPSFWSGYPTKTWIEATEPFYRQFIAPSWCVIYRGRLPESGKNRGNACSTTAFAWCRAIG